MRYAARQLVVRVPERSRKWLFCVLDRQGALANGLHGLNPTNTAPISPVGKRRPALVKRLVKDWATQVILGSIYKRINPSSGIGYVNRIVFLLFCIYIVHTGSGR